jgi:hypothetical protein
MQRLLRTLLPLILALLVGESAFAQPRHAKNILFVKFKDDTGYGLRDGHILGAGTMPAALDVLGYWDQPRRMPKSELDKYRAIAAKNLGKHIYDPSSGFYFHLYDDNKREEAKQLLKTAADLDYVLDMPVPVKPPVVPDYQPSQTYPKNQTSGINAEAVWSTYNNRGTGVKVCDIEYGYTATHNDINPVTLLGPAPVDPFGGAGIDHGTAVLGEIGSVNNGWGTTGIASDCQLYFSGVFIDTVYDLEAAVLQALPTLSAGDVLLLEQQIDGPNFGTGGSGSSQFGLVPVEWYKPYYDAIVLATGQGITVVEAAGNGEQNLDAPEYSTGNNGHYPFLPANNSGAVIVGAGAVDPIFGGSDSTRARLWYSNYGARVDVQGNGERVTSTGYGDLYAIDGPDKYFTSNFGGTSSASPIVTGAVVLLQSVYKQVRGSYLSPAQVRTFLKSTGKAQKSGIYNAVNYHIGPLPDVYTAVQSALASGGVATHNNLAGITVAPNPAEGVFHFSFPQKMQDASVIICDVTGRAVWAGNTNGYDAMTADVSAQAAGLYIARITVGGNTEVKKLVIAR